VTSRVYTIGGREFSPIDLDRRTVRQDHFMVAVFRRTGVDRVSSISDEDPKEFLIRLHGKLLASGLACEVLSAFLVPVRDGKPLENKEWRQSIAKEVQEHLEGCDTEIDRNLVNQLAFEVMTGFFKQGLLSLLNTLKSSQPNDDGTTNEIRQRIEESSETKRGNGPLPSVSLRGSITTELSKSSTGR
jgi:hypothetical protein